MPNRAPNFCCPISASLRLQLAVVPCQDGELKCQLGNRAAIRLYVSIAATSPSADFFASSIAVTRSGQRRSVFGDSFFRGMLVPGLRLGMRCSRGPPLREQAEPAIKWVFRREPGNQNPLPALPSANARLQRGMALSVYYSGGILD